ncbi:MAG: hybrid sensor histidine kinase/response regulator [Odoribacter sp.]
MQINPSEFKLLIVDDIQTNILLLRAILKKEGYHILTAASGLEALNVIQNEMPDLILLDVMMPGMDGFEVAGHLKGDECFANIPIMFITALDDTKNIVNGFQLGACDFISKPFCKEELVMRIKHQLDQVLSMRRMDEQTGELKKKIDGRDRIYSAMADSLQLPVTSTKMLLNAIMASVQPDKVGPNIFEMLEMSNKTSEEAFNLLDNLLKWTKNQLGELIIFPQKSDITKLVNGIADLMIPMARAKHIRIEKQIPLSIYVEVDTEMIKSVLRNLFFNAIKYSSSDSEIQVILKEKGTEVIISIVDSGVGIKKEDQLQIMDDTAYFTTDGTYSEKGSGLGFLLCRDFIRKNGGELWFESEENVGSVFSFSLPKLTQH